MCDAEYTTSFYATTKSEAQTLYEKLKTSTWKNVELYKLPIESAFLQLVTIDVVRTIRIRFIDSTAFISWNIDMVCFWAERMNMKKRRSSSSSSRMKTMFATLLRFIRYTILHLHHYIECIFQYNTYRWQWYNRTDFSLMCVYARLQNFLYPCMTLRMKKHFICIYHLLLFRCYTIVRFVNQIRL